MSGFAVVEVRVDEVALDSLIGRVRAMGGYRDEIIEALSAGSRAGANTMRELAPKETGRLAESVRSGPVAYLPGGLGGGGFYEFSVTVGDNVPYSNIVVDGRRSIITAPGHYMSFAGTKHFSGQTIFTRRVRGYTGRTAWIEAAQVAANEAVERKLDDIDRGI